MDYRNERDALRGRVDNLEQELAEAKGELRGQRSRRRRGALRVGAVIVVVVGIGVGAVAVKRRAAVSTTTAKPLSAATELCARTAECCLNYHRGRVWRDQHPKHLCEEHLRGLTYCKPAADDPGDACQKLAACEAKLSCDFAASTEDYCRERLDYYRGRGGGCELVEPPPPVATARTVEPPTGPFTVGPRFARPHWRATVRRSDGLALAPGTACLIEATVEATGTNAHVRDLELRCGIQTLYTSTLTAYRSDIHDDVRERLRGRDEESTFTLQYGDEARNGNQTSKVDLDSAKGTVVVQRRISLEWRVELTMPAESQPTAPLSGVRQRLRREGHVTMVSGAAIVSPGASCVLRAMPNGNGDACVAEVRCGAAVLFPTSADVRCTYDGARPIAVVSTGERPTLRLDGQTLEVQTASRTVVSLELSAPLKHELLDDPTEDFHP